MAPWVGRFLASVAKAIREILGYPEGTHANILQADIGESAQKTIAKTMLKNERLEGYGLSERMGILEATFKHCSLDVTSNAFLLHTLITEHLRREQLTEIHFESRIIPGREFYTASFPGAHKCEWDRATLMLVHDSIACTFLPENSPLYGEHAADENQPDRCYCQTCLYCDAPEKIQRQKLHMLMDVADIWLGQGQLSVGQKVEVHVDMPSSAVRKWWLCTLLDLDEDTPGRMRVAFDGLARAMKPQWMPPERINTTGERKTTLQVGQVPFGCEWFNRWKAAVATAEEQGQTAQVVYKKGFTGLQTFKGLGISQLKEVEFLEKTYPAKYGRQEVFEFPGTGSLPIGWDTKTARVESLKTPVAGLSGGDLQRGMQLVAIGPTQLDLTAPNLSRDLADLCCPCTLTFKIPGYREVDAKTFEAEHREPAKPTSARLRLCMEESAKVATAIRHLMTLQTVNELVALARCMEDLSEHEVALGLFRCAEENAEDEAQSSDMLWNMALLVKAQGKGRLPEAMALYQKAVASKLRAGEDADVGAIYGSMATLLREQGKLQDAVDLHEKALAIKVGTLGKEHAEVGTTYHNMANVLRQQAKFPEAMEHYEKALAITVQTVGEEHPEAGRTYCNMAAVLKQQGKLPKAMALCEKALNIQVRALGEDHTDVGVTRHNMATVLAKQGRFSDAVALQDKALTIFLVKLDEDHAFVGEAHNSMADILRAQGKLPRAMGLFKTALDIRVHAFGEDHAEVGQTHNDTAKVLQAQGKFSEAMATFEKALAIRVGALGESHPDVAESHNGMARVLLAQGRFSNAMSLFEKALDIRIRFLGEEHPDVGETHDGMASVLWAQGKLPQALKLFEKALAIRVRALGEEHPDVGQSHNGAANVLHTQGLLSEAIARFERALAIRRGALGEDHAEVGQTLSDLAKVFRTQGNLSAAMALFEKSLAIRVSALGEDHVDVAETHNGIGTVLWAQGNPPQGPFEKKALAIRTRAEGHVDDRDRVSEAIAFFERALAIRRSALGADHPDVGQTFHDMAKALYTQGKVPEAVALFEEALAVRTRALGESHADVGETLHCMGQAIHVLGDLPEAMNLLERAVAVRTRALGQTHSDVDETYDAMAKVLRAQGKTPEAIALLWRRSWQLASAPWCGSP